MIPLETLLQHVNSNYGIKTVTRIFPYHLFAYILLKCRDLLFLFVDSTGCRIQEITIMSGPAELLRKWGGGGGGGLTSDSKWGAENTSSSVTLYNFQKSGGGGGG